MEKDKQKTIVIFKKEKGDVLAFFPELPGTNDRYTCTCYAHLGQHGSADVGYCALLKPARPEEYADLAKELESIGYNLDIRKKVSDRMNRVRYAELERLS